MKIKRRYKRVLRNLIAGMRLERVMWDNGKGYNIYFKLREVRGRLYLAGISNRLDESSYYYYYYCYYNDFFVFKILLDNGLKVWIENYEG